MILCWWQQVGKPLILVCVQGEEGMLEEEILRKPDLAQDKLLARMRKVGFSTLLFVGVVLPLERRF